MATKKAATGDKVTKPAVKKAAAIPAAKPAVKKAVAIPAAKQPAGPAFAFTLDAPNAGWVSVVGPFNGWSIEAGAMKRDKSGLWTKSVKLSAGQHEYKFVVDGEWWADPVNPRFAYNPYGTTNSLIEV